MSVSPPRIRAIDWLRGLAVLVMVQTHTGVLLAPQHLKEPLFAALSWVDGLVAPAFIFSAGFSLALVQVRGAASGTRAPRVRRTLRRLGEVLGAGVLLNALWFNVRLWREPLLLVRLDILVCIGLGLLLALPLLSTLATRPRRLAAVTLLLALSVFGLAPLAESLEGPWAWPLQASHGAPFALLPWAGYVYLGASAGALAAVRLRHAVLALVGLGLLGAVGWELAPVLRGLYPPHSVWVTGPAVHAHRLEFVCALLLVLLALERWAPAAWRQGAPVRFLEVFGTSSLAAYLIHELLIYTPLGFKWWWGGRCGWALYWLHTLAVVALTYGLLGPSQRAWRALSSRAGVHSRLPQLLGIILVLAMAGDAHAQPSPPGEPPPGRGGSHRANFTPQGYRVPGRPPESELPWEFFLGHASHRMIAYIYSTRHPTHRVFYNTVTIETILWTRSKEKLHSLEEPEFKQYGGWVAQVTEGLVDRREQLAAVRAAVGGVVEAVGGAAMLIISTSSPGRGTGPVLRPAPPAQPGAKVIPLSRPAPAPAQLPKASGM